MSEEVKGSGHGELLEKMEREFLAFWAVLW
jgi:hypothetical protein